MTRSSKEGFWTLQKKLIALASTIVAITAAIGAVVGGGRYVSSVYANSVAAIARSEANALDKKCDSARFYIDSAILQKLDAIRIEQRSMRMEQRKSAFIIEKAIGPAVWKKYEVGWRVDSIRFLSPGN